MTTMRERLIRAAESAADYDAEEDGYRWIGNWLEVVDAILAELREPDKGMIEASLGRAIHEIRSLGMSPDVPVITQEDGVAWEAAAVGFTAMIDHVRAGK